MGKRSDFERLERDYYPTPYKAVKPLLPHLPEEPFTYCEPCAGDGRLVEHLLSVGGICTQAVDIEPQVGWVGKGDVFDMTVSNTDLIITNPPWDRKILHPLIVHLSMQAPTWLLFDADWKHTVQAKPYLPLCTKIVSVGRVKWIEGSKSQGMDNCAWYLFDINNKQEAPLFYGRY